ncbi:MAG: outer membrane protein assembly factor BamD [Ignavibacteria bacterium]|nr:outer membrane protein assembly factor BamD [Ignavibacteria bacterium]
MKELLSTHIITSFILAGLLCSCGSSNVPQSLSAEERFDLGKKKFDNEDYLEAVAEFEIVKLQYPGSAVADDAQYYLAESHFKREEYLLAAEEYQTLIRNFRSSSLVPLAQYKTGLSYYYLSPKAPLEQKYTLRAIDELQSFIEYNPKHELVPDAEGKIKELDTRLAQKLYDTAVLYMKMEYFKSATVYYSTVVEKYHDTPYAEPALIGKVRSLVARKKYDEAKQDIDKFFEKYPNSRMKGEAESLRDEIEGHLKNKSAEVGHQMLLGFIIQRT